MTTSFMALLVLAGLGINGMQTLLYVLAAQAFPTSLRATGVGSCGAVGRIASISSVGAGAAMLRMGWTDSHLFLAVAVLAIVPVTAMLAFPKHIKRLE
jgi:AAHS family 4-hydroxybenzoate transporter-like MFS transporter